MSTNVSSVKFDAPYWVLDTDYENYSVIWSCVNFGLFSTSEYCLEQFMTEVNVAFLLQRMPGFLQERRIHH